MNRILVFLFFILLATPTGLCRAESATPTDGPVPDSEVLVIFVDGLRPDTVDDMVAQGQLPNIKRLFYDQGLRFENFFTIFPSLTVPTFGALITGKTQDQSGLKSMSLFERFPTRKKNIWKRMFRVSEDYPRYFNMLTKVEKAPELLKRNKAKAFYNYLGEEYHTSLVPVSPSVLPWAWPHMAANTVEKAYQVTTQATEILDDLNGKYALRYMAPDGRGRLFIVWFPLLDHEQHRQEWGQFSPEGRALVENMDQWLGKIYDGFVKESPDRRPYVVLFSDHGAYGGKDGIYNQPYYLGRDLFYKILKMNVRGPDYTITNPGTDLNSFTYVENFGRGQARIFLPVGDSLSGNWERPNTLYELTHYGLGPNRKSVNLVRELMGINLSERNQFPGTIDPRPVDLAFVKLSEDLIYVIKRGGAEALIEIEGKNGNLRYRYTPVQNVSQDESGHLSHDKNYTSDPFGYLTDPKFNAPDATAFIQEFHNDQEWLDATYKTVYPDAITAISRALIWKPELSNLAKSRDPDIWLSATPGWNFRIEDINGADHGAILRDSMLSTLMISGPNVRAGVDPTPHRIIDVTPTLLQLIGYKKKMELNSAPIKGIYEN